MSSQRASHQYPAPVNPNGSEHSPDGSLRPPWAGFRTTTKQRLESSLRGLFSSGTYDLPSPPGDPAALGEAFYSVFKETWPDRDFFSPSGFATPTRRGLYSAKTTRLRTVSTSERLRANKAVRERSDIASQGQVFMHPQNFKVFLVSVFVFALLLI